MAENPDGTVIHYTYRAEWSPQYREYLGRCLEFPWLYEPAPTPHEAVAAVEQRVNDTVAAMVACGEALPISLTERNYSGKFMVRTSRALHARLTIEAIEEGVSLNQWVVQKLVDRPPELL
jgi:HicB family